MPKVEFEKQRCKGCGLCIWVCPRKIIKKSKTINSKGYQYAEVTDQEECIACGFCYEICPDTVVKVSK